VRRATTALVLVCLVPFGTITAFAGANTSDPPPPTYVLDQSLQWTQNPQRSVADRATGTYNFNAGLYGAARRPIQRFPSHYLTAGIDVRREAQVAIDSLLHMRPGLPYDHAGDVGNPELSPDWDHDGVFGDSGGTRPDDVGDFDADTDEVEDTAYFRIPCYTPDDDWEIHHRYASGSCDTEDAGVQPYKIGVAKELKIIDARGLVLDATLSLPATSFTGTGCPVYGSAAYKQRSSWTECVSAANLNATHALPGVVFANGLASRQEHYSWITMRLVDEGYIVLNYDPAGQGNSEGTFGDTLGLTEEDRADPQFAGAVRDLQDAVRWFVGQPIAKVTDNGPRLTERANPSDNIPNPSLGALDVDHLAIAGNSMGAISTLAYLDYSGSTTGLGADGRPLPKVVAAISMSGARATHAVVPIQFQTSDGDGSPLFVLPKVGAVNLGFNGQGIGYELIKERYDAIRETMESGPLSLIVMEGGTHTDHVDVPFVPRTYWANALAADYAADWLNCYVKGDAGACAAAVAPRPHLSRTYASEQDPDGPIGPSKSRCITVPDAYTLSESPKDFFAALSGSPNFDCTP
jgi:hypothetical protein